MDSVAKEIGASKPYIVGGVPRDKLLNRLENIEDIDITTGDEIVHELARALSQKLPDGNYKILSDGHAQIQLSNIKIDFSSNFIAPGIDEMFKKASLNPSSMLRELYSRDFTVNCLLLDLDLETVSDPTGLGLNDIEKKNLRTPLPARLTLGNDNKRVVRVLYLAAKLGFEVDNEIIDWIKKNPESIANVKPKYLAKKLGQAIHFDVEKTARLLTEMGLWSYVPILPELEPYYKSSLGKTAAKKKKNKKRVDQDVRPYPNPFFTNYDYTNKGPNETSPGGGPWFGTPGGGEKSMKDWIEKRRKQMKERRKKISRFKTYFELLPNVSVKDNIKMASDDKKVVNITDKLEQKKIKEELSKAKPIDPDIEPSKDELKTMREQVSSVKVQEQTGLWFHRFSDVRKDDKGFFILKQDNPAGNRMLAGQQLADFALNWTPYWLIKNIEGNRINLQPIGPNPFLTGVGAGGAKLTNLDVSVFTGDYEKKRIETVQKKINDGDASIDDVVYLLDGTVPVNMGPNGAQGGWYNVNDRSSRGGRKGMTPEQTMMSDAKKLVQWGFSGVPRKALDGSMSPDDWDGWMSGNGDHGVKYVPKNLDNYIDFHRQMTQKGRWRYDDATLEELRRRLNVEAQEQHWEKVIDDFTKLPRSEFQAKYKHYPETLQGLVELAQSSINDVKKNIEKQDVYLSEGEESGKESSIVKNVFHKERRVAIRNTVKLIDLAKEDRKYVKYLHDVIKLGGTDWYANEKILEFFDLVDDIDGLKLAAETLKEPDNLRYAYGFLMSHGEQEWVLKRINDETPFPALKTVIYKYHDSMKQNEDQFMDWVIKFVEDNSLFDVIDSKTKNPKDYVARHEASELLSVIYLPFRYLWNEKAKQYKSFMDQVSLRLQRLQ